VERLGARRPVLMIVEDAHWIDPTSREWFDLLIDGVSSLWVLLIITFRPELTPSWTGRPQVTLLSLGRLPPRRCAEMITHMTGGKALPKEIADQIVDRTDGVPLFIEELTKAVIESGVLAETGDGYGATGAVLPLAIPTSLHASLLARLDRLASVREVAQIAAALGRQFSYLLISAVAPRPRQELDEALAQLVRAELIFQRWRVPDAEYAFKHVLVADAAYGTLLRSRRQQIHARIAKVLEEKFPERATVEPELLAHHLTEAAQVEAAISYWLKAGRRAAERSANEEAVRHLKRGLKLLTTLPESTQRDQLELEIQLALATPLVARHGFSSPIIGAARDRAIALCEKLGDRFRLLPCLYGKFAYCVTSGKIRMALEYAERCQSLAAETGDRLSRLITLRAKGSVLLEMGEFQAARVHLNQLLAHYSIEQDRTIAAQYVADPRASGLVFLALALWALGYPDQAIAAREQAFKHAADLNHANTSGFVYIYGGAQLSLLLGNMDDVRANLDKLVALVEERMPHWGALDQIMMGWALASAGPMDEAIALLQKGIDTTENMGGTFHYPHYISLLAILNARAGNMQDSLGSISKAKALIADSGEYFWHADVLRIEGELGLLFGQSAQKAEMCFVQALEVARKQHAKSFELRAATSLAGLWSRSG
jgi:predicted ATPase